MSTHKSTRFHQTDSATSLDDAVLPSTCIDEAEQQIIHEARQHAAIELYAEMTTPPPAESDTPSLTSSSTAPDSTPASSDGDAESPGSQSAQSIQDSPPGPPAAPHISQSMGKYSDLTIVCKNRSWQAHKIIVSSKSPLLEAGIEALDDSTIDLSGYPIDAVACVVEYIYNPISTNRISPSTNINVFILASALQIADLQSLAVKRFQQDLTNLVTDANVYFEIVRKVYKHTTLENPELRMVVVDMAMAEMQKMLADENVRWAFLKLTSDVTEFQTDIYEGLMGRAVRYVPVQPVLCDECGPLDESEKGFVVVHCERCKLDRKVMIG